MWRVRVEGDLPGNNGTRVMTIVKLKDGSLLVHNATAFGEPAILVVPNGYHRLDSKVFKKRYPKLKVIAWMVSKAQRASSR